MEESVAGIEPAEGRRPPAAFGTELFTDGFDIIGDGQYAVVSDQSVDLRPKGNEGDEVDDAEQADENPAGEIQGRALTLDRGSELPEPVDDRLHPGRSWCGVTNAALLWFRRIHRPAACAFFLKMMMCCQGNVSMVSAHSSGCTDISLRTWASDILWTSLIGTFGSSARNSTKTTRP